MSVTANTQYDVSTWVRGTLDSQQGEGGWAALVLFYDLSGNSLGSVAIGTSSIISATWQQFLQRVTTPVSAAQMRIVLFATEASGWVAFDDVSAIKVGTSTNLVLNPGFESASNWTASQVSPGTWLWRSTGAVSAPRSGSYAYAITNDTYGTLTSSASMAVSPGTTYTISAWLRGELDDALSVSGGGWQIIAMFYDANDIYLNNLASVGSGNGASLTQDWKPISTSVTIPANASKMRIRLFNYYTSGWVTYDDISVTPAAGGTNLVVNGNFESAGGWDAGLAPSTAALREATGRGGSYGYTLTNNTYGNLTSGDTNVTAGTEYKIATWLRGELADSEGMGGWILRAMFYNETAFISQVDAASGNGSTLSTSWQQVSGMVTAPTGATRMNIVLINQQSSGWVAFDDVSLTSLKSAVKYYYAGSQRVAMRKNGVLSYLLTDQLGSTSVALDASGAKISEVRYDPWGKVRYESPASSLPTDYTYTGQRDNSYINLLDYGSRYYDPALGRFISPDSIVPSSTQGVQALDRYAFVNNNPTRYTDPSGHCISDPVSFMACAMVAGALIGGVGNAIHQYNQTGHVDVGQAGTAALQGALIGGGVVIVAVAVAVVALVPAIAAVTGAACADGDCTNEISAAGTTVNNVANSTCGGDCSDEISGATEDAQALIDDIVQNEFKNVRLSQDPQYDAGLNKDYYGEAMKDTYTKIGSPAIESGRRETVITIAHEEMHHRLWERMWAQSEDYVEKIAQRFARMIGN